MQMVLASRKEKEKMKMKLLRVACIVALIAIPASLHAQTLGTNTQVPEGNCVSGVSATDIICANTKDHQLATNPNNAGLQNLPRTYYLASDYTNATTVVTAVTGLTFPVNLNGSYHALCRIVWQASAQTAGPKYIWTGPNVFTLTMLTTLTSPFNFTSFQTSAATTYSTTVANTNNVAAINTNFVDTLDFALINGANTGTVQLLAAANGTGTLTIKAGSNCVVQ